MDSIIFDVDGTLWDSTADRSKNLETTISSNRRTYGPYSDCRASLFHVRAAAP